MFAAVLLVLLGSKAPTGMEGPALMIYEAILLVKNGLIFLLVGSTTPRTESR